MAIGAFVRADSVGKHGIRITTLELRMPRCILAQFNKHRMFSSNAGSSRAIPVKKYIEAVMEDPYVPARWGTAQRGMVAGDELGDSEKKEAIQLWYQVRNEACRIATIYTNMGVAKEIANRILEPFAWVSVLITATEWENFYRLRLSHDAQPEMQELAQAMHRCMRESQPNEKKYGEWHMPFGDGLPAETKLETRLKIATARAARLSYNTHDGDFSLDRDIALHDNLLRDLHLTPLEHSAICCEGQYANFRGWQSYRNQLEYLV